ncbi:hypothetical protein [Sphingopyxis sp. OPL5]|uniref:hypothetical protein n=1 Tax=Sphingopyxis sp. OPL5 TaxID=2486273 RepID=UPI00223BC0EE|nr:hypothetical protein [Sphingopyxis sp. OPL5]
MTARVDPQVMICARIWLPDRQITALRTRLPNAAAFSVSAAPALFSAGLVTNSSFSNRGFPDPLIIF